MSQAVLVSNSAQDIARFLSGETRQVLSFNELSRRMTLLATALAHVYQTDPDDEDTKTYLKLLNKVVQEVAAFVKQQVRQNVLSNYFKRDFILKKLNGFDRILRNFCRNLHLTLPDWDKVSLPQVFEQDLDLWATFINNTFETFRVQDQSLDQLVQNLGISTSEMVDTIEVLRTNVSLSDNRLAPEVLSLTAAVREKLSMQSGRKVVDRANLTIIPQDELRFLDSRPFGQGSFGEVFAAVWQNQKVAVKRAKDNIRSEEVISMLEREARIWFPLKHKNVIPLWGVNLNTDKPYLVMPFMKNGSLMDFLSKYPDTPINQRLKFGLDVCYGLDYLHKNGVAHGDLKIDNLMLDDQLNCLLTDFGMSSVKHSTNSTRKQETGAVRFVAPERYRPKSKINEASDMFAFAMSFYHALVGKAPFYEEYNDTIVKDWIQQGHRPEKTDEIPNEVWDLLNTCWCQDEKDRPKFTFVAETLASILENLPRISRFALNASDIASTNDFYADTATVGFSAENSTAYTESVTATDSDSKMNHRVLSMQDSVRASPAIANARHYSFPILPPGQTSFHPPRPPPAMRPAFTPPPAPESAYSESIHALLPVGLPPVGPPPSSLHMVGPHTSEQHVSFGGHSVVSEPVSYHHQPSTAGYAPPSVGYAPSSVGYAPSEIAAASVPPQYDSSKSGIYMLHQSPPKAREPTNKKKFYRKKRFYVLLLLFVLILIGAAIGLFFGLKKNSTTDNNLVSNGNSTNSVSTFAGSDPRALFVSSFMNPTGLIVDSAGTVYTTDSFTRIVTFVNGQMKVVLSDPFPDDTGSWKLGSGTDGSMYVVASESYTNVSNFVDNQHRGLIAQFTSSGSLTRLGYHPNSSSTFCTAEACDQLISFVVNNDGTLFLGFNNPNLTPNTLQNGIYTTFATYDYKNNSTLSFSSKQGGSGPSKLDFPICMALDTIQNVVYVMAENALYSIKNGLVNFIAGNQGGSGSTDGGAGFADGFGPNALFNVTYNNFGACGLAVGPDGTIYVADSFNHVIRTVTASTGQVKLFAGTPKVSGYVDSAPLLSQFNSPRQMAVSANYLYVADRYNNAVRRIKLD
ncbi:hypothetical protein HDU91_007458 [Kappamyces sp. JEL0680]|nr:hypothetical protein HDU91_007458 [Kappamyces sp. JEL0680]